MRKYGYDGKDAYGRKEETNKREGKFDIAVLENGMTYVKASRKILSGENIAEWRKQITGFFQTLLDGNDSLDIHTIEGDILTITRKETANKARDNYYSVNGKRTIMTDDEFAVKLKVVSHIDEIAETSRKQSVPQRDTKNHSFAKDGFIYRTAYFEVFDGQYYRVTLSVGKNDSVATVYNVGKIKEDTAPSAKLIAVVGSQPRGSASSDNSISQNSEKSTDFLKKVQKKNLEEKESTATKHKQITSDMTEDERYEALKDSEKDSVTSLDERDSGRNMDIRYNLSEDTEGKKGAKTDKDERIAKLTEENRELKKQVKHEQTKKAAKVEEIARVEKLRGQRNEAREDAKQARANERESKFFINSRKCDFVVL